MAAVEELQALTGSIELAVPILTTRFSVSETDPPFLPPPYSSMIDDVNAQIKRHLEMDKLRQTALHSVKLQAGQSNLPEGELGRPYTRDPILAPELLGGRVLTTNV